ncbi:MAG: HpsJ family protein [Synechococcus sp. ELA057]
MATPSSSRFLPLLRWMGITLVVLLVLQLLAVLTLWDWNGEAFRQLVVDRLISQSPMALVGLLLMLVSSRLEDPTGSRSPLRWTVAIISGVLALALISSLPISINGDQILQQQSDQQLNAKKSQLEAAKQQSRNPALLQQLVKQAEAAGQLPEGLPDAQKIQFAQSFVERQLDQMEAQVKQTEQTSQITLGQRRYVNSGGSVVLIVAFTLLCLASIL